jgi:hypothetical protein
MWVFAIGIEYALDVAIQCPQHADARKHCRPVLFGDQDQAFHGCLPLWRLVLGPRKLRDVIAGVLERDKLATAAAQISAHPSKDSTFCHARGWKGQKTHPPFA